MDEYRFITKVERSETTQLDDFGLRLQGLAGRHQSGVIVTPGITTYRARSATLSFSPRLKMFSDRGNNFQFLTGYTLDDRAIRLRNP